MLFAGNSFVWNNPKYFITPLFFYISAVYAFQGIYHWFYPLPELFEDDEETKKNENVVDVQKPEIVEEQQIEENDKKDSN